MKRHNQRGVALIHALLILGAASALTFAIAGSVLQQSRSERIAVSRATLDKSAVKLAGLVDSTGTNPLAPPAVAGSVVPSGGGLMPTAVTPQVDAFGTPLGYCVGTPVVATDAVFAVISAGGSKTFDTSCAQALAGTRIGDDLIFRVNVSQLYGGFSGVSYHGATVAKEGHLGSILNPRSGEIRAVVETGAIYTNASGRVGDWTALTGGAAVVGLVQSSDGVRRWADGSYAATCQAYRYPSGLKVYRNAVGDGVYRLQPGGVGTSTADVYCDQSTDGGGWTLVFAGDNNSGGHDLTIASVTAGMALPTYSSSPSTRPVLPTGLTNNFGQALFKGGNSTWQSLYGAWVRFSMLTASAGMVSTTFSGVASAAGRTSLWSRNIGWGLASADPSDPTSTLTLWDAGGVSPNCGGNGVPGPKNCPSFTSGFSSYAYHYDATTYRELYVR
ncbi:fibrinogen-like YCDxxxxGGGW domain-containing protein [Cupriavidus sp. TMH.W2]|uniref:fibrinogen-like YCDxxxxGGGW domain-containing protein n=1 Tax=Cupriavidus sp. TMH.W2 TaxID=3434465 RepID=UPI003D786268